MPDEITQEDLQKLEMRIQELEDKLQSVVVTDDDIAAAAKVARASGCAGYYLAPCFSGSCPMCMCPSGGGGKGKGKGNPCAFFMCWAPSAPESGTDPKAKP